MLMCWCLGGMLSVGVVMGVLFSMMCFMCIGLKLVIVCRMVVLL